MPAALEARPRQARGPFTRPLVGRAGAGVLRALAALLLLLLLAAPATAAEAINRFASHVVLFPDGTIDVTETIEVNAEGIDIRRGIYRDIFTVLINPDGSRLRSDLKVVSAQRDGQPEPFRTEAMGTTATRVYLGDANVFLSRGTHRYVLRYTMSRMARFFPDHDELYWNATGNFWSFPILAAEASVSLPAGAVITGLEGYTGAVGSTEQAVDIVRTADNTATFHATRVLGSGEGLTIVVGLAKGVLAEPQGVDAGVNWLSDHRDVILPLLAVLIVLAYNVFAWNAVGRDPQKGVIIPLFHAPKDFSPSLTHYVHNYGWTNMGWTAFTAAIFDLGVKGLVTVSNVGKALKVDVTGKEPEEKLPAGEKLLFDFFRSRGSVIVNTANGPALNTRRGEFTGTIERENRLVYFNHNLLYVVGGVLLSVLCLGALILMGLLEPVFVIVAVVGGVVIGVLSSVFSRYWKGGLIGRLLLVGWLAIAGVNLVGGLTAFLAGLRIETGLIAAISIVVINVVFGILMRAPTVQGRKVMDQIDGFKMYLETAEKNRLNIVGEPPMTISRFERILPYAIALGVEKPWSEHFEGELARNAVDGADSSYQPSFYHGSWSSSSRGGGFSNAVTAAATGMSAAMIAAQPASSSSSGFSGGGGGFSGGGGGGGGGGGW